MRAAESLSAIRRGEDSPREPGETLFEAVAKTVMQRYKRVWKPRALYVNRRLSADPAEYRRSRHRRHRPAVRKWFASLRATPVAADRSMPVLSVIMREAEAMGLRPEDSNPGRGIRRYRRKGRERFLSQDELRRLSERLSAHATRFPQQVAVIRPLLLTGCRKGEILTLLWSDYREEHLFPRDSKIGPRTVWLPTTAPNVLGTLDRTGRWVFPACSRKTLKCDSWLHSFRWKVRMEANLCDVRLHDLRRSRLQVRT